MVSLFSTDTTVICTKCYQKYEDYIEDCIPRCYICNEECTELDTPLVDIIVQLWKLKISTLCSCAGHSGKNTSYGRPYIIFGIEVNSQTTYIEKITIIKKLEHLRNNIQAIVDDDILVLADPDLKHIYGDIKVNINTIENSIVELDRYVEQFVMNDKLLFIRIRFRIEHFTDHILNNEQAQELFFNLLYNLIFIIEIENQIERNK